MYVQGEERRETKDRATIDEEDDDDVDGKREGGEHVADVWIADQDDDIGDREENFSPRGDYC